MAPRTKVSNAKKRDTVARLPILAQLASDYRTHSRNIADQRIALDHLDFAADYTQK